MKRSRTFPLAVGLAFIAGTAFGAPPAPPVPLASALAPPISGIVRTVQSPVGGALIVLYNVAETSLARLRTATDGTFVVASAPVGVYDLIAYKRGFQPALIRIVHQASRDAISAVEIQLASVSSASAAAPARSSIWEMADRLPPDVLRELDIDPKDVPAAKHNQQQVAINQMMAGEVATVAGSSSGDSAVLKTSAALRGGLPNGWGYNVSGDYNSIAPDPEATTGNSAGLALAVAPSSAESVQLTARRNAVSFGEDRPASLQASTVTWSRGNQTGSVQSVAARYLEETNLYRASAPGTTLFPIASRTWEIQGNYARPATETPGVTLAMSYRHREAAVGPSGAGAHGAFVAFSPDADLAASTTLRLSSRAQIQGGVVARTLAGGYGVAPRIVARYEVAGETYVFVGGLYRVAESGIGTGTALPRVASLQDDMSAASTQLYSAGIERVSADGADFRVEASDEKIGEMVRLFFEGDFLNNLDSVFLFDGNTVRQYQATGKHRLSQTLAATASARYGQVSGAVTTGSAAAYGIADSRGYFWSATAGIEVLPTQTGVAVLLHGVRQQLATPTTVISNDSDKIALSLAQDLSVLGLTPFGSACKLLLAVETNRVSPPQENADETAKNNRFMGGVALAF